MSKINWGEDLLTYLELVQFFTVKDESRKIDFEKDGKNEAKTYTLDKTAQESDFHEIYEREFKEVEKNIKKRKNKRGRLIKDIRFKIDRYEELTPHESQNDDLIFKANSFIQFLIDMDNISSSTESQIINLESLFQNQKDYEKIIGKLLDEQVLIEKNGIYRLNPSELQTNHLKEKRAICALGFCLNSHNYLKPSTDDIKIAKALSSFFSVTISKATYHKAKDQCFINRSHKAEDYFNLYYFF